MKAALMIARILVGLVFVVFGLNGFLGFIETPAMSGSAAEFMGAMASSNYLSVVKVLEIVGGLMLLVGFRVPLGITILTPIILNIFLFHIFLAPISQAGMSIVLFLLNIFLIYGHWNVFGKVAEA